MSACLAEKKQKRRPSVRIGAPVPRDLEAVVLRCLAKSPADRFDDAAPLGRGFAAAPRGRHGTKPWLENGGRSTARASGARRDRRRAERAESKSMRFKAGTHVAIDVHSRV
jgi:hypothetical protein